MMVKSEGSNLDIFMQDDLPLISIVTVVLNGEDVIEKTILSVIQQTYPNIEYIVIDGNSKDKTLQIIKKFRDSIDHWISRDDKGIYHAMNLGASMANGDLLGFLNAGDILFPQTINSLASEYKKYDFDYSIGSTVIKDLKGRYLGTHQSLKDTDLIYKSIPPMPSAHMGVYMKKSFFYDLGGFDLNFHLSADYDLLIRAINISKNAWFFQGPVGVFRTGGVSGSFKTHLENYKVYKKHLVNPIRRSLMLAYYLARASLNFFFPTYILYKIKYLLRIK